MSDQEDNVVNVDVDERESNTSLWTWVILGLLVLVIAGMIFFGVIISRQLKGIQVAQVNAESSQNQPDEEAVPPIRIPGLGSQKDHSGGLQFARINVHDDEAANQFGWYDRTVINTEDPTDIGLEESFTVPEGWTVERDYSLAKQAFQPYFTVKPLPTANIETINTWIEENNLQSIDYEVTSVVVDEETGQECSVRGLSDSRIRTNIYVGENFVYQLCPPIQDN